MAEKLSAESVADFKAAFDMLDTDHSGNISVSELEVLIRSLGQKPTREEMDKIVKEIDADGSGEIGFPEFLTLMSRTETKGSSDQNSEEELRNAFLCFDTDGDGTISFEELKQVMINLEIRMSDSDVREMLEGVDTDKDGNVSFDEFKEMMKQM